MSRLCINNSVKTKGCGVLSYQRADVSFSTFWYFFFFKLPVGMIKNCITMDLPL